MEDSLYSTGEFAQLCGVKKQTLFHYDSIGLLKPAHIDENGFRHYSYSQYEEYLVIACLKEAGMSLRSIKAYLDTKDKAQRARVLQDCITQLDEKIEYLKHVRQVLANSFPKQTNDQAHPAELEKDTTLLYREQQEYWATQRLDALDDKQLVEAVAKIVKVAEFCGVCLPSEAVEAGNLDLQSHLLVSMDKIASQKQAEELGLEKFVRPEGRYAEIELYQDDDPALVYERLLTDIHLMHCHPGQFFYEMLPETGVADTPQPTVISVEIFLDEDTATPSADET